MEATQVELDLAADAAINCYNGRPNVQALIDEYRVDNVNRQSIGDKIRAMRLLCHPGEPGEPPGPLTADDLSRMFEDLEEDRNQDIIIIPGVILRTIFPHYDHICDLNYTSFPNIKPNPHFLNRNEREKILRANDVRDEAFADYNARLPDYKAQKEAYEAREQRHIDMNDIDNMDDEQIDLEANLDVAYERARYDTKQSLDRYELANARAKMVGRRIPLDDTRHENACARAGQLFAGFDAAAAANAPGVFNNFAVETLDEPTILTAKAMKTGSDDGDGVTSDIVEEFGNFHIGGKKWRRSKKYKNKRSRKYEIMRGMVDLVETLRIGGKKTKRSRKYRKNHKKRRLTRKRK